MSEHGLNSNNTASNICNRRGNFASNQLLKTKELIKRSNQIDNLRNCVRNIEWCLLFTIFLWFVVHCSVFFYIMNLYLCIERNTYHTYIIHITYRQILSFVILLNKKISYVIRRRKLEQNPILVSCLSCITTMNLQCWALVR